MAWNTHTHTHTHTYIYIYIYKNCHKKAVLLPIKSSSDDEPGFRHCFGVKASLPFTQGTPALSHNTTRPYSMVFDLYECHIRSDVCIYIYIYREREREELVLYLIELPWPENPVNTHMWHTERWTAVSTLLGLISSAYRDLHH